MDSNGLLDFMVHLVRPLLAICVPCMISAFERRSDIIVADQDINFLFNGLGILFVFYCSLLRPSYPLCMFSQLQARPCLGSSRQRISKECNIDTKQAARERLRDPCGARPRICVQTLTIAASLVFQIFRCAL